MLRDRVKYAPCTRKSSRANPPILFISTGTTHVKPQIVYMTVKSSRSPLQTLIVNAHTYRDKQTIKQKYIHFSPRWALNYEDTPQNRACSIARSAGGKMTVTPLARNALAGLSVTFNNTLTSSSSSNFPFNPHHVNLSEPSRILVTKRKKRKPGEQPFSGVKVQVWLIFQSCSFQIVRWNSLW